MRSSKLKLSRLLDESDDDRDVYERFNEFVVNSGDQYILPYLDVYDKDKFGAGKFFWFWNFKNSVYELAITSPVAKHIQNNLINN